MPALETLWLFIAAALVLLITPGPAVFYIVTRSLHQGRAAGVVSALGIHTGTLFHIAGAALGLSALLTVSATAFHAVKLAGAAYLVYLGVRTLRDRISPGVARPAAHPTLCRVFFEGLVVNVLNPKTALFFLAFLPQFVDVSRGSAITQILILGGVFLVLGVLSDSSCALLAGTMGNWLRAHPRAVSVQRYFTGSVYIGLGIATALSGAGRK